MLERDIIKYIMDKLKVTSENDIQDIVELSDGKSGAQVHRIKINSRRSRLSGHYIIKCLDMTSKWYDHSESEAERCKKFYHCAPEFRNRLIELEYDTRLGDRHVLIYKQANDGIINSVYLDKLPGNHQIECLSLVSEELLTKMNFECLNDDCLRSTNISDFFTTILGYRLNDATGAKGSFYRRIEDMLINPFAAAINIGGKTYPNPGYCLQNQQNWIPKNKTINLRLGLMHGDLHYKNIICVNSRNPSYSIIDYDSFNEAGYLFFDHAYLELYAYLSRCASNNTETWEQSIRPLLKPLIFEDVSIDEVGFEGNLALMRTRNAICGAVAKWVNASCKHMKDDIEIQFCLARVAAGINFFSKGGIQDFETLKKLLIYIGISLETLFDKLEYTWPITEVSTVRSPIEKQKSRELMWDNCARMLMSYVPILVTDDAYEANEYSKLEALSIIPWGMVLDCGEHVAPLDFSTAIPQKMVSHRHVDFYSDSTDTALKYVPNSCMWLSIKKEPTKPFLHSLLSHQNNLNKLWNSFLSSNELKPYLFIFDCKVETQAAKKIFQLATDAITRLKGSRFIALQKNFFSEDEIFTYENFGCKLANFPSTSLIDLADTIQLHYSISGQNTKNEVVLPCLDSLPVIPLTEKEISFYQTSVELVYPSMALAVTTPVDGGIPFYQGNEASWDEIAHNCDLRLLEDYENKINTLKNQIEQGVPHIQTLKVIHGAGTGGTTLSKRILWDMKETAPSMRLLRYTRDTANILLEIYNKHKKTVLLSVEVGSTVINTEELAKLCADVEAQNGRLWILQIERKHNTGIDIKTDESFISLDNTLPLPLANHFHSKFKKLTQNSTRHMYLNNITNSNQPEWLVRRCPFFYGFYTFEEDYRLDSLHRTIKECNPQIRDLLSDMALVTIYSQNISISSPEMARRIPECAIDALAQTVYESLDTSISKFIVNRNNGWRICHPIIAQRILKEIYKVDGYLMCVYHASVDFVDRLYSIYGENDERVDAILRELFIDRTEIDNEKMKFSTLIEDIPEFSKRIDLFDKLIKMYPSNAHYYNHMARLRVSQESPDYSEAIRLMEIAIEIANQSGSPSIHYVTLGSIYSKRITAYLHQVQESFKRGSFCPDLGTIISEIDQDYHCAENAFVNSRNLGLLNSSYIYFPRLYLECRIIDNLVMCDKQGRHIDHLFHTDNEFHNWYFEHYGKAVQIFEDMQRNCFGNKKLLEDSQKMLDRIALEDSAIENRLNELIQDSTSMQAAKRTYVAALFSRNHYSWKNIEADKLGLIEKAMRQNLHRQLKGDSLHDIDFWFEAYRRLPSFNVDDALQMLTDYKEDGYQKEYLLSILYFLKLERGLANPSDVFYHISACKNLCPATINTVYVYDAYSDARNGCPIISTRDVPRGPNREFTGLKTFSGTIRNVYGGSSGIILVDNLNLEATFVPAITDESGHRREFTTEHIQTRVSFNLMFSYSGLRAWNIVVQDD